MHNKNSARAIKVDYPMHDILQMLGRASRPGMDVPPANLDSIPPSRIFKYNFQIFSAYLLISDISLQAGYFYNVAG